MKRITLFLLLLLFLSAPALAVEVAPRISDREIIESLAELKAELKAGQKNINNRFDAVNQRIDDLGDFLKIFIVISSACLGFVIRMVWKNSKTLETQKDEIAWLKEMINKLLPPRQIL